MEHRRCERKKFLRRWRFGHKYIRYGYIKTAARCLSSNTGILACVGFQASDSSPQSTILAAGARRGCYIGKTRLAMEDPKILARMRADWNHRAGEDANY